MNENVIIDKKDLMIMKLLHYFVTEEDYNPIILHGVNDEIWLENLNNPYKVVRIVNHYIHNNEQLSFDNFKVIERDGSSKGGVARWKCICKHCGNIFTTEGANIRSGESKSCGCIHSRGEQIITQMLIEEGCEFSTQYTFPDLVGVNGGHLRFDFAIFLNGKLDKLIEFNGLQHYEKPEGRWGDEWENLIENDKRKKEYCKKNCIDLKIIKYDQEFDIKDLVY